MKSVIALIGMLLSGLLLAPQTFAKSPSLHPELLKIEEALSMSDDKVPVLTVDKSLQEPYRLDYSISEDGKISISLALSEQAAFNKPELALEGFVIVASVKRLLSELLDPYSSSFYLADRIHAANATMDLEVFELLESAKAGSLSAKLRLKNLATFVISNNVFLSSLSYFENKREAFIENNNQEIDKLIALVTKDQSRRQKQLEAWRKSTGALEHYEAMNEKLNDLVLKNDRVGVRKLLEAYLPWPVMEPLEKVAWKNWLEAIEKPNTSDTIVAFRGLGFKTDKVQKGRNGEIALLSTVLTANQGSYTRRLRSLSVNRLNNGDKHVRDLESYFNEKDITRFLPHSTLNGQFKAHSREPRASSFLSFSLDPAIAWNFTDSATYKYDEKTKQRIVKINGGAVAVKMDRRRLMPNLVSGYKSEIELLTPLIVFPDEIIVYMEKGEKMGLDHFYEALLKQTGVDYKNETSVNGLSKKQYFLTEGVKNFKTIVKDLQTFQNKCESMF